MIMERAILLLIFLTSLIHVSNAQNGKVTYVYDAAGNRVSRTYTSPTVLSPVAQQNSNLTASAQIQNPSYASIPLNLRKNENKDISFNIVHKRSRRNRTRT